MSFRAVSPTSKTAAAIHIIKCIFGMETCLVEMSKEGLVWGTCPGGRCSGGDVLMLVCTGANCTYGDRVQFYRFYLT